MTDMVDIADYCRKMQCTACCQWGRYADKLKPSSALWHKKKPGPTFGDCVHLDRKRGCKLWGDYRRPAACNIFDCREYRDIIQARECTLVVEAANRMDMMIEKREGGQ